MNTFQNSSLGEAVGEYQALLGNDPSSIKMEDLRILSANLERHEEEMIRGEKFVYTVLSREQTEVLGCIYIFPSRWDDHDAEISMWTTEDAYNEGLEAALELCSTESNW